MNININIETQPLTSNEDYINIRIFQVKEIISHIIFGIGTMVVFILYKSYVATANSDACIFVKGMVGTLANIYIYGTPVMVILSMLYCCVGGQSSRANQRKLLQYSIRGISLIMIFVYYIALQWIYWPELSTCNLAFVFSILGILILDILLFIYMWDIIFKSLNVLQEN